MSFASVTVRVRRRPWSRTRVPANVFGRITNADGLRQALLQLGASAAPGVDGFSLRFLTSRSSQFEFCRGLRAELDKGTYVPGPVRTQQIPKRGKRGHRTITIQNARDKVVDRHLANVLHAELSPRFSSNSFGSRRGADGRLLATAITERLIDRGNWYLVIVDLKDAFGQVPVARLMDLVRKQVKCGRTKALLAKVLAPAKDLRGNVVKGLRQGSPVSPMMLDLYLSATLDEPFKRKCGLPLIRFVDDLLVACESRHDAEEAYHQLVRLARSAAMRVKESLREAVVELAEPGHQAQYLGYHLLIARDSTLQIRIGKQGFENLRASLLEIQSRRNGLLQSPDILRGWIQQQAPCFRTGQGFNVFKRIKNIYYACGLSEYLPKQGHINQWWKQGVARWEGARSEADHLADMLSRRLDVD